ncbi:MAG: sigma-70 family RNA polymerase sigma factor [Ktedonobacteraceae bacterium]|nr:sigma-70 family RNA polymerase sigma factor [Ktedonobacteraceae bacterium]
MTSASQALETLIAEYGKLVFHVIYGLTHDWEDSQDLTQDTFYQALKSIDAARAASGSHFHAKAWLLRIALNTVRMQRRRRNILRFIPFSRLQEDEGNVDMLAAQATPVQPGRYGVLAEGDPAENIAERDAVQRTLAKLAESLRVCLLLSIVAGLTSSEIAKLLDMKEAAVRQRLVRARQQFQQLYRQESGEDVSVLERSTYTHVYRTEQEDRVTIQQRFPEVFATSAEGYLF